MSYQKKLRHNKALHKVRKELNQLKEVLTDNVIESITNRVLTALQTVSNQLTDNIQPINLN